MIEEAWLKDEAILNTARAILKAGFICDECFGRAFARLGHGLSNRDRGRILREALETRDVHRPPDTCWVCQGLFGRVEDWAGRAVAIAAGIEHDTYLFGVKLTPRLVQMEAFFLERFSTGQDEPLKHAFNRELGKAFEAKIGHGTVHLTHPHLFFLVDLAADEIEVRILPLYIYGRYQKLLRGIPQTHWPCRRCHGRGCEACALSGKQYPESVEELIAAPFVEAARSRKAFLHGAGREDIDARMLGTGRPFVLEVIDPRRRTLDLPALEHAVNRSAVGKIAVFGLRFVPRETVVLVKQADAKKTYRARVAFDGEVSDEAFGRALTCLVGPIEQQTPKRVAHRRADRVRKRRLLEARGKLLSSHEAKVEFRSEGGLYIKELVSGDDGRTTPNLSDLLGIRARVTDLDVLSVSSAAFPDEGNT